MKKLQIVALSDSHNATKRVEIPDGDILIHAGDFSFQGKSLEIQDFIEWMNQPRRLTSSFYIQRGIVV